MRVQSISFGRGAADALGVKFAPEGWLIVSEIAEFESPGEHRRGSSEGLNGSSKAAPDARTVPAPVATVLVVDDQVVNRQVLKTVLGYKGYAILEARNGEEALRVTRAARPDVVISDIVMPNLDGFQFVSELRKDPTTSTTSVVFYTGVFDEVKARQLARDCGVEHLLTKPAEPAQIIDVVGQAVAESRRGAPKPLAETFTDEYGKLFSAALSSKILELEEEVRRRAEAETALLNAYEGLEAVVAQRTAELREANKRLAAEAVTDPLTGLYNRRLSDLAERELSRARRGRSKVAFAMVDIDHFKSINDRFGHEAGDRVLQQVSGLLRREIRQEDLAFRYGGEEFLLMLACTSAEAITPRLEQLRQHVADMRVTELGMPVDGVTVSIGVAMFPDHGEALDAVVRSADEALYRAKGCGRNQVVHAASAAKVSLES